MCVVPMIMMILYAGLALGPLMAEKLNESCRDSSGKEDEEKKEGS